MIAMDLTRQFVLMRRGKVSSEKMIFGENCPNLFKRKMIRSFVESKKRKKSRNEIETKRRNVKRKKKISGNENAAVKLKATKLVGFQRAVKRNFVLTIEASIGIPHNDNSK